MSLYSSNRINIEWGVWPIIPFKGCGRPLQPFHALSSNCLPVGVSTHSYQASNHQFHAFGLVAKVRLSCLNLSLHYYHICPILTINWGLLLSSSPLFLLYAPFCTIHYTVFTNYISLRITETSCPESPPTNIGVTRQHCHLLIWTQAVSFQLHC